MEHSLRSPFAGAVVIASELVLRPEVAARWTAESACADMSVGALARHLVSQWSNAVRLLRAPAGDAPITARQHYERAAWVHSGPDDDANVDIRQGSEVLAAEGPEAMEALVATLAPELSDVLARPRDGSVLVPWQGWSLSEHDFLVTRLMEIVVHSDDLGASVGVDTLELPAEVLAPVLDLLTGLAVRRHGSTAVVRTLARPQRAPRSVSAF
jgi:hypothetical protein